MSPGCPGPIVLVVLDGVGIGAGDEGDAVFHARTPVLDDLKSRGHWRPLIAHGTRVGLPSDGDMGNSEVGHNALGSGQIVDQGAKLVGRAIDDGTLWQGQVWRELVRRCGAGGAAHFIGLLSDGNVHSHIDHLIALLRRAASEGCKKLFVHILLDGRDVGATSALTYVDQLERVLAELRQSGITASIASGGGRMKTTMDRYEADWEMVARGWRAHVHGDARPFASATEAIETARAESPGIGDQQLPPFAIHQGGAPVGPIRSGDSVVFFNFRGDRAIEISRAFDDDDFRHFERGERPEVLYAGMMEYDGDLHIPKHYLVDPPSISNTLGENLAAVGITQLAISETQKYGHVTYFWNGNRSGMFDEALETYIEVPSDVLPFEERPWMKAAEITDRLVDEIAGERARFYRVNYANGDMVGHTGDFDATVVAVEAVDLQLRRLREIVDRQSGILLVTADHGNADDMVMRDKKGAALRQDGRLIPRTSHSLSAVPFVFYGPRSGARVTIDDAASKQFGLANVAGVVYELLGYSVPDGIEPSFLVWQ